MLFLETAQKCAVDVYLYNAYGQDLVNEKWLQVHEIWDLNPLMMLLFHFIHNFLK